MGRRLILGLVVLLSGSVSAAEPDASARRELFRETDQAVRQGRAVDLDGVLERLGDYPLAPYLRYHYLLHRLDHTPASEILDFRREHPGLPVLGRLEVRWLERAGAAGRWQAFRRVDRGYGGAALACYRLQAERAQGGVDDDWLSRARKLWTVGVSQPDACDPVFTVLYENDALSAERRWERIRLIMRAGDTGLARAVRHRLEPEQRRWLNRWLRLVADPGRRLADPGFDPGTERGREIIEDAFHRLGQRDPERAMELLGRYREQDRIDPAMGDELQRYVALRAAYDRHPRALEWLEALPEGVVDARVRQWTAHVALGRQDWPRLMQAVEALPASLRDDPQWRYWRAVALVETGDPKGAMELLGPLSEKRHYYGFLAADMLGRPYVMNHRPASRDDEGVRELARRPGLVRARELFRLGYHEDARREWYAALAGEDAATWADAAHLALDWGWHARTVDAANRAGLRDALELRFPLAFRDDLPRLAEAGGLDASLAYALARKESGFDPGAVSPVGARGLMQLMPGTARKVARRLDHPLPTADDLFDPETSLRLGSAYLDRMLERFEGSLPVAVAAYNAGPLRAEDWVSDNGGQPGAVWVENITYRETRDYVKSVLAFRAVFDWRLHGTVRRLSAAMAPVMELQREVALQEERE